jgi:hypothetical protein
MSNRPQASPAVQVKELQKRIDSMSIENESLIKRYVLKQFNRNKMLLLHGM